ncbi:MAG: tetratricopeptide repeat protein [Acidobacteriia bacterium]|nr:tetratricopeptide repeat protein [Terriglobia bacterium]
MRVRALVISLTVLAGISGVWGQTEKVVFVSGDVRLEDGTAPPDAVQINRACNGRTTIAARTDTLGHFAFSVDAAGNTTATADAGQAPNQAEDLRMALNKTSTQYTNPITTALRDCEVQAVLSGFRTESVRLSVRDTADDGRLGTIILHPLSRSGSLTISATTAAAPVAAKKAYDKGMESIAKEKWDMAESELTKAVTIYPKFAIAWYHLGQVRQKRNAQAGAIEAWNEARKQDPKYVKPYEILAAVADRQQDWAAAEQYSREWLQLDPDDFAAAYLINAIANARLNRIEAAELAARGGLRVDKDRRVPRLNYVLGLILMEKQQYAESAKYLHAYLELAPNAHDAAMVREQVAKLDHQAEAGPPTLNAFVS